MSRPKHQPAGALTPPPAAPRVATAAGGSGRRPPSGRQAIPSGRWLLWLLLPVIGLGAAFALFLLLLGLRTRPISAAAAALARALFSWRSRRGQVSVMNTTPERLTFYAALLAGVLGEAVNELLSGPVARTSVWQVIYIVGIGAPIGLGMWMATWLPAELLGILNLFVKANSAT